MQQGGGSSHKEARSFVLSFGTAVLLIAWCSFNPACAQAQSEICRQYVACQQEYDAAAQTGPTDLAQYQADGICWLSAENIELCDRQCRAGIAAVKDALASTNLEAPSCG